MAKYVIPHKRRQLNPDVSFSYEKRAAASPPKKQKYIPPALRHARHELEEKMFGPQSKKENPNVIEHKWSHKAVAEHSALDFYCPGDRLIHEYLNENSEAYRDWKSAKRSFGSNPRNDSYFYGKYKKRQVTKDRSRRHMAQYYEVFLKMNKEYNILNSNIRTFADVCCAPGGFAKAVLDLVPTVRGEGMTIDPDRENVGDNEKSGHEMQLPNSARWNCFFKDVMERPGEITFFGGRHRCDFVIVDGNFLFTMNHKQPECQEAADAMVIFKSLEDRKLANEFLTLLQADQECKAREVLEESPELTDMQVDWVIKHYLKRFAATEERIVHVNRFLCSKILVGLHNLCDNCTLLVQNGIRPSQVNIWLWGMLIDIFREVTVIKATLGCHGINSSAYVLCKGYRKKKAQAYVIPMMSSIMEMLDQGCSEWFEIILADEENPLYHGCNDLEGYLKLKGKQIISILETSWCIQSRKLREINKW